MIRVLVADDSPTLRRFVLRTLETTRRFTVCGLIGSGEIAVDAVRRRDPDVVVMDLEMPGADGLAATRAIMAAAPRPIVLFCSLSSAAANERAIAALAAGAVALVPKPGSEASLDASAADLCEAIEQAAATGSPAREARSVLPADGSGGAAPARVQAPLGLVAVGASTGGPAAVAELIGALPAQASAPIVLVQHMTAGFLPAYASWLGRETGRPTTLARPGEQPAPGRVHVAPSGAHLVLRGDRFASGGEAPAGGGHVPSVDVLFESVARAQGARAAGVLLTGLGRDGAAGLLKLREAGALTFAQDERSSSVWGMPKAAIALGAACRVGSPESIARALATRLGPPSGGAGCDPTRMVPAEARGARATDEEAR